MRKLALAPLLALSISAMAAKPNPADYTIKVHVITSAFVTRGTATEQSLEVSIDGQTVELYGGIADNFQAGGVLNPGDYSAKLVVPSKRDLKYRRVSDVYKTYEFLFSDGSTRKYQVTCMGPRCSINMAR